MRFACEPYRESGVSILSGVDDIQVGLELLPPHLGLHELPGDVGRPHPEGADHAQLGVHQALRGGDEGVGGQADLNAGKCQTLSSQLVNYFHFYRTRVRSLVMLVSDSLPNSLTPV